MPFSHDEARQRFGLTPKELEIVSAVVAGYTNKEIAERFKLSLNTVKFHLVRILEKFGVSTRLQLALLWLGGPDGPDGDRAGIAVKKPRGPSSDSGSAAASLDE